MARIKLKECIRCKQTKKTTDFPVRTATGIAYSTCRTCKQEQWRIREEAKRAEMMQSRGWRQSMAINSWPAVMP